VPRAVADVVSGAARALKDARIASSDAEAVMLVAHALDASLGEVRSQMITGATMPDEASSLVNDMVARRRTREPLQHITGLAPFRTLELHVGPGVFVPRPETEVVAQVAIDAAQRLADDGTMPLVVDLCAGSGAISLSIAAEVRGARVVAVEREHAALEWLRRNRDALPEHVASRVEIVEGDVTDPAVLQRLNTTVDVVVSNPPYVPPHESPTEPEAHHDPDAALYGGGADGMEIPRGVMATAARLLVSGGLFVMEHSSTQGDDARAALASVGGFGAGETLPDLTGRDRMVVARRPGGAAWSAEISRAPRCGG